MTETFLVSNKTAPAELAGAIANTVRGKKKVIIEAIGASAVNQTMKGIAVARGYLAPIGIDLVCRPAFMDVEIEGEKRTGMRFFCEPAA